MLDYYVDTAHNLKTAEGSVATDKLRALEGLGP